MGDDPVALYTRRLKRVMDSVALKVPDRIPLIPQFEAFPVLYAGNSIQNAMYNNAIVAESLDKFYEDFQPDLGWGPGTIYDARVLEACGVKWLRWPGNGIENPYQLFQFVEGEFMHEQEYDELIEDPTHFIQSKWIPRCFSKLEGLRHLRLRDSLWGGFLGSFAAAANKEAIESLEALINTAKELGRWFEFIGDYERKMESMMGFPMAVGSSGFAPFDLLGDTLRGTMGMMSDVLERPDKVLQAVEALLPIALEAPVEQCKANGRKLVWIWLHKGGDEFMSNEHYKSFYWPTLKKMILGLIEEDLVPVVYCEGKYNTRLEFLRDVPPGKVVYDFEYVDMFKAKEVLEGVACIAGNLPNSMLLSGGPEEVDAYCKKLLTGLGRDGGFMLDAGAIIDNARKENLQAMFAAVEKYGS